MRDKVRTVFGFFLVLCLVAGYSPQASSADYRPVAVEKAADIAQLEALIGNYTTAWKNYANNGDRDIFRYLKNAESGSDQVILRLSNDPVSFISAVVSAIDFADSGEKAHVYVWGRFTTKVTEDGVSRSRSGEYSWTYEAEKGDKNWVLSKCNPNAHIFDRSAQGNPRSIFINHSEFLIGDGVFFANPKDEDKLYRTTIAGTDSTKLLDDSVSIEDLAFPRAIVYINKSRGNEIWKMDSRKFVPKKAVMEFADRDRSFFTDGYSIFKTSDYGKVVQRIFSRVPFDRGQLILTAVKEEWIYFFFFSEGEKEFFRVKTDGAVSELLTNVKADWRDEER